LKKLFAGIAVLRSYNILMKIIRAKGVVALFVVLIFL